jgi:hypothetical protein
MLNLVEILKQVVDLLDKIRDLGWKHIWLIAYCATLLVYMLR